MHRVIQLKHVQNIGNELIFDVLKKLQEDNIDVKRLINNVKENVMSTRNDIHTLRSDILRQEKALAAVEVDVDRIKNRLDIIDQ